MSNHDEGYAVPENRISDEFNTPMEGLSIDVVPSIVGKPPQPIFHLDVEKYIGQLDCYDMSEQEKNDLLYALWDIMCRFVELGFGVNSYPVDEDKTSKISSHDTTDMLK